jgi:hypothetical protein
MAERVAVVTVLYPAALPFAADLVTDLNAQDDRDFTVVAVLDNVAPGSLVGLRRPLLEIAAVGTPAALRARAIAVAAERADLLIFVDADDRMRPERVAAVRAGMAGWEALAHDFTPFAAGSPEAPPALHGAWDPDRAFTAADLQDGTCIGFGASACRAAIARATSHRLDPSAEVFDWGFYATLLHQGAAIRFLDQPLTRYRQHAGNLIGWGRTMDAVRGCRIKAAHYRRLLPWDPAYRRLAAAYAAAAERLATDAALRDAYARRPPATRAGWWYDLILPEDLP